MKGMKILKLLTTAGYGEVALTRGSLSKQILWRDEEWGRLRSLKFR